MRARKLAGGAAWEIKKGAIEVMLRLEPEWIVSRYP
jgi:hypothetical protein